MENGNTTGKVVGETPSSNTNAQGANPQVEEEEGLGTKLLDGLQWVLDAVGLIPGIGEPVDLVNAGISAARGDFVGAGLSLGAAVPVAGWGATGAKVGVKGAKKVEKELLEKAAKEKAEKEALEKAAKEKAEKEAAEKAAKEKTEKEAAEKKKKDGDSQVKKRNCKSLEKGPPGAKHQGGKHGKVKKDSVQGVRESHHMPPDSISPKGREEGTAISMDYADHRALSSTGRSRSHPTSIMQENLAKSGPAGYLAAMMMEINEIRQRFPGKYEKAIAWTLLYAECMGFIPSLTK